MSNYTNQKSLSNSMLYKLLTKLLILGAVLVFTGSNAVAQRIIKVAPGLGTLNEAIDSDTTAGGERTDLNTVYELKRGGYYALEGSIQNRFPLTIVAEDGDGDRPILLPAAGDGGTSSRPFRARADLTLKGLYITGIDNLDAYNGDQRIIRISENDVRIVIDDCHLDGDTQAAFRVDNSGNRIFVTNSIISNIGTSASPDNGRAIDDRGSQIDTLVLENNTFYNLTSQVLRDAGGEINYARVNHNTAVNIGKNGAFEFGQAVEVIFTNNLIIDGAFYGIPEAEDEILSVVSVDSLSQTQVDSLGAASITISNNNIYSSQTIMESYPDTVNAPVSFNATALAYIEEGASGSTNISESITFTDGPAVPLNVVTAYYLDPAGEQPDFPTDGEPFDFGYASSFNSYTAAVAGQQLGSLIWHGGLHVANEEEVIGDVPSAFVLHGNYPNPFNPTTQISFSLAQAANVQVDVYNVMGQRLLTVPSQRLSAGASQSIQIDASSLASGLYIYRVTAVSAGHSFVNSGRMTLIK